MIPPGRRVGNHQTLAGAVEHRRRLRLERPDVRHNVKHVGYRHWVVTETNPNPGR